MKRTTSDHIGGSLEIHRVKFKFTNYTSNIETKWEAGLLEIPGSDLGLETGYPD
jgi:hypothetical protein